MIERLAGLDEEYEAVLARLSDNEVLSDHNRLREESKRHKQLEPIVLAYRQYRSALDDLSVAKELGMKEEADEAEARAARLEEELKLLLLPKDPNDDRNVISL